MNDTYMTIRVDGDTRSRIATLAAREHRSSASQVKYMLEKAIELLEGGNSGEAQDLRRFLDGCPAAKSIEALTEAQG
jgi:predicted transcriptional regulator